MEIDRRERAWGYDGKEGMDENVKMMIEAANEELQILESQHPNRFEYLKLDLKSFIFHLLHSQNTLLLSPDNFNSTNMVVSSSHSSAATQASSTSKVRKKGSSGRGRTELGKIQRANCGGGDGNSFSRRRDNRVEVVIERAQTCLQKIQQFKTSF